MKKFVLIFCIATVLNLMGITAYAETSGAVQKDNSFPVRYLCESLGAKISWNAQQKTVTVNYRNKSLELRIGSKTIISNGKQIDLENEISTSGGRALLPVSVLNNELGLGLSEQDCLSIVGKKFIGLLNDKSYEEAEALLSRIFSNYLTSDGMEYLAEGIPQLQPADESIEYWQDSLHQIIGIPLKDRQNTYYTIRFDHEGKIDELGIFGRQPEAAPAPEYASAENFTETEVVIGTGAWALPGTLTMPKGDGPFPAVILVHDSGALDRDETTGYIKPFRDIAYGLASRNIAVLRYDKRTLIHSSKLKLIGNVTLNEETEQDAYAAAEFLKTAKSIDNSRIITLGHSLGGYAVPRIMATGGDTFKAGIIMNGFTRPQYELMPEYLEYLEGKGLASAGQLEYVKAQVEMLSSPGFNPKKPPESYTMGNLHYYSYMKDYDVMDQAGKINKPVLVMQGQRDFIVSTHIDFTNWKKAFEQNINARFKLYPELNHLLTGGEGDSTPQEYYSKTNIPEYVIGDIVDFINKLE
ncbi:alpha/beta hydrolase family protein [Ruminiclostridium cellobioparum]|uniref:alpha/beta hydrolase family protein n=1 Tax=Ruminiclostridium cellobioparum TaxID=29355 RepID=UPI0028AF10C6|nr:stalk domain-containing protein [Ruminiclostridium cellobioparum]